MEYLNIREIMTYIDDKYDYIFKGKSENDNLISKKTWNKYVSEYLEIENENEAIVDEIIGGGKGTKYKKDFVEKIIKRNHEFLKKQRWSNRKTVPDLKEYKIYKMLDVKEENIPDKVKNKRMIKTQFNLIEESRYPVIKKEDVEKMMKQILDDVLYMDEVKNLAISILLNGAGNHFEHKKLIKNVDGISLLFNPTTPDMTDEEAKKEIEYQKSKIKKALI